MICQFIMLYKGDGVEINKEETFKNFKIAAYHGMMNQSFIVDSCFKMEMELKWIKKDHLNTIILVQIWEILVVLLSMN